MLLTKNSASNQLLFNEIWQIYSAVHFNFILSNIGYSILGIVQVQTDMV